MIGVASVVTYELFPSNRRQINRGYVVSYGSQMSRALFHVPLGNFISFTLDHLLPVCRMTQKLVMFWLCNYLCYVTLVLTAILSVAYLYVTKCACMCLVCSCAAVKGQITVDRFGG